MFVVADSGSTKTDWVFILPDGSQNMISTAGFNPVLHDESLIRRDLETGFRGLDMLEHVEKVFFYGSGCWDKKRAAVIERGIRPFFSHAEILVEHDLLGAARATCGTEPGIACILGTGSNSCLFDGRDIVDNVTNLGYLLGDEGSGTHMGKMAIRAYFYREMPPELEAEMAEQFPGGKTDILDKIYQGRKPNVFLASFASWVGDRAGHPFIQQLVRRSFCEFLDRHVRKYQGHEHLPIHFVGSLAYHLQGILLACCEERNLNIGKILPKPVGELVTFHLRGSGEPAERL